MRKLVPLIAALSFAAAIPAYAATQRHVRAHAQHRMATQNEMAPAQPMETPANYYKAQDLIISHIVGVPG